jgi:hypothetical protein
MDVTTVVLPFMHIPWLLPVYSFEKHMGANMPLWFIVLPHSCLNRYCEELPSEDNISLCRILMMSLFRAFFSWDAFPSQNRIQLMNPQTFSADTIDVHTSQGCTYRERIEVYRDVSTRIWSPKSIFSFFSTQNKLTPHFSPLSVHRFTSDTILQWPPVPKHPPRMIPKCKMSRLWRILQNTCPRRYFPNS